jgi:hypothetical protein
MEFEPNTTRNYLNSGSACESDGTMYAPTTLAEVDATKQLRCNVGLCILHETYVYRPAEPSKLFYHLRATALFMRNLVEDSMGSWE